MEILDGTFQGAEVPASPGATLEVALQGQLGLAEITAATKPACPAPRAAAPQVVAQPCASPLVIVARAIDPLVLPASPETGNITRSLGYVSGTTLRGAVAATALRAGWDPDAEDFQSVFVQDGVAFGPMYPALDGWDKDRSAPFPAPLAAATCKWHPGICGESSSPAAHGMVDLLGGDDPPPDACGRESCRGWSRSGILQCEYDGAAGGPVLRRVETARNVRMHVTIKDGRAVEHELFANEELPEETVLVGLLWGDQALLGLVRTLLADTVVSVGKARSRGAGRLVVKTHEGPPGLLCGHATDAGGFTLTLYSDLIAVDPLLRPVVRMDEAALWRLVGGTDGPPFKLVRGYGRSRRVASFNGLPGRPRTIDTALVAGSCWRYRWTVEAGPQREKARGMLAAAESSGLGVRRGEGFGRVVIDHPLHRIGKDQGWGRAPTIPMTVWTPAVPGGRSGPLRMRPSPSLAFNVTAARPQDRDGLARLLLRAAHSNTPRAVVVAALNERGVRGKSETGTDRCMRDLVEKLPDETRRDGEGADARRRLVATATALVNGGDR